MKRDVAAEPTLLHMIKAQEETITALNEEMRMREDMMREAIAEADKLKHILSSTFMRMLAARITRT